MNTTVGQIMVNEALPPELRDYDRVLDKKSTAALFREVAEKHPEKYADINRSLNEVAAEAVTSTGRAASLSLDDFRAPPKARAIRDRLRNRVERIVSGPGTKESKDAKVVSVLSDYVDELSDAGFNESVDRNNALAQQVLSGARGNRTQMTSLHMGDILVSDHKDQPVPIPMLTGYAEGLDPVEYWAGSYGARKGYVDVKLATPEAGYLGKQLTDAAHRLTVTEHDCGTSNGAPADAGDPDNEGSIMLGAAGGVPAGTVLMPDHVRKLSRGKDKKIVVRSALTCEAKTGICRLCAGKRESGDFPGLGSSIGITAAQAVAEPLTQAKISSKHYGGAVTGKSRATKSGFDLIKQLVSIPKTFAGGAAIAEKDGFVRAIRPAPQGGKYIMIGDKEHWVPEGTAILKKPGQSVEAGDILTEGIPNPAALVRHKGVGAGRLIFTNQLRKALQESKINVHRRNLELLARGLVNHVRITDTDGPPDTVPNDIMEYDGLVRGYTPRYGTVRVAPKRAVGLYLERPALQYSIGTRVTPSVINTLGEHSIKEVHAHKDKPSFTPEMVRAMESLGHADDWMVRLGGYNLKKTMLEAAQRGRFSAPGKGSFIPALAKGTGFGKQFQA